MRCISPPSARFAATLGANLRSFPVFLVFFHTGRPLAAVSVPPALLLSSLLSGVVPIYTLQRCRDVLYFTAIRADFRDFECFLAAISCFFSVFPHRPAACYCWRAADMPLALILSSLLSGRVPTYALHKCRDIPYLAIVYAYFRDFRCYSSAISCFFSVFPRWRVACCR